MAKLIKLLAASIGGGMALGFGVRAISEAAGRRDKPGSAREPGTELDRRLATVERRLLRLEDDTSAEAGSSVNELESKLRSALRHDVERQVRTAFDDRVSVLESKLRSATVTLGQEVQEQVEETLRRETTLAVERGIEGVVGGRISRLEQDVAAQSAAMDELRECSMHTERNLQKLLAGIERLVSAQDRASGRKPEPDHQSAPPGS